MNGLQLRYKMKYLLVVCTRKERTSIRNAVQLKTGISDSSFSRYINLRKTDNADIPASVLRVFAQVLGTTMEELFVEVYEKK